MPQFKSDIQKIGKLNLTEKEIKQIHARKIAVPGKIYSDKLGNFYVGTKNRRLKQTQFSLSGDISTGSATGGTGGNTNATVNSIGGVSAARIAEMNTEVAELLDCIAVYFEIDINGDLMAMCDIHKEFDDHMYDIDENGDFMPAVVDGTRSAHFTTDELNNLMCKPIG